MFQPGHSLLRAAFVFTAAAALIAGCGRGLPPSPAAVPLAPPTLAQPGPSPSATRTPLPTQTNTPPPPPTLTPTPTASSTPTPAPSPTWAAVPAGPVTVPVLLYHHISKIESASPYYLTPAVFEEQMRSLRAWGYTTIPVAAMVAVIKNGGTLPPRPVIITFDDGNVDVYNIAFPIMQKYGFTGTFYVISHAITGYPQVNPAMLKELIAAGWEIGSHGMTHADLKTAKNGALNEMRKSKQELEDALGVKITSFAYPYGSADRYIIQLAARAGYDSGAGLGPGFLHTPEDVYYFTRIIVENGTDLQAFASRLPWFGPPPAGP